MCTRLHDIYTSKSLRLLEQLIIRTLVTLNSVCISLIITFLFNNNFCPKMGTAAIFSDLFLCISSIEEACGQVVKTL